MGVSLGRWVYCKYCDKCVLPREGDGIVVCAVCGYGLASLDDVIKAGSYKAWWDKAVAEFRRGYKPVIHKCLRCGWEWASRNPHPVRCAKCKTPYWDKERKVKSNG